MIRTLGAGLLALSLLGCSDPRETALSVNGNNSQIDVSDDIGPVLRYQILPPDSREPWRANYLHPVFTPDGVAITENAPADHIHHRGIFWSWRGVFIEGKSVGDAWIGEHISYTPTSQSYGLQPDGSVRIETGTLWHTDIAGQAANFLREETIVAVWPVEVDGSRRLHLRVALTALVPGVSLAGSDNEKGYGGLSFRLGRADQMDIASDGQKLIATPEPVQSGDRVEFIFRAPPAGWPSAISIGCTVNGKPWHNWILRQESSMQNCAWPGRNPAPISMDTATVLEADLIIRH